MTDLQIYDPPAGQLEEYRARIVMDPQGAKALDDQLRACMTAVLREGTDYGVIPGTGDSKALYQPGAQKLLQWFGLGFTNDRAELDRDDQGRKEGVTYRCTVTKQLPGGRIVAVATCEGYAGYDEDKFYQPAEQAQRKAEEKERYFAHKDRRVANPTRWQSATEYRAPWHTLLMMAQKRALVGAAKAATAASGLFGDDPEDTPGADAREPAAAAQAPPRDDDSWPEGASARSAAPPPWAEQALKEAGSFKTEAAGGVLYREAAAKVLTGECTPGQATHIQNAITARITARRKEAAERILKPLAEDDPWRDKILDGLDGDEEARDALAEVQQLLGSGQLDDDRAGLLGRAVIARYPKAALAGDTGE